MTLFPDEHNLEVCLIRLSTSGQYDQVHGLAIFKKVNKDYLIILKIVNLALEQLVNMLALIEAKYAIGFLVADQKSLLFKLCAITEADKLLLREAESASMCVQIVSQFKSQVLIAILF